MKRLVVLILFLSTSAQAQYFQSCNEPFEPSVPSGLYEAKWEMENAQDEIEQYLRDIEEFRDCIRANYDEASESAQRVISAWEDAVQNYQLQ